MTTQERDHDLITASRVKGTPVYNTDGAHVGHVEDISIEKTSGQVRYALMSFGGFLGIADKLHPLPWSVMHYDKGKGGYVVPLNKDELTAAPSYTLEELQSFGGRDLSYRETIYQYYGRFGALPYW